MQQGQFLSFNKQYTFASSTSSPFEANGSNGSSEADIAEALKEPLRLKDTWVLWEQVVNTEASYKDNTREVVSFNTVQDFWSVWYGVPQPSELLDQKRIMRRIPGGASVHIDALMVFKQGIAPTWEHAANAEGGHFQYQLLPSLQPGQIDEYWNNIVLGMIGRTLEPADMITGVRLVDKLVAGGGKLAASGAIRLELWFQKSAEASRNALQQSLEQCMTQRLDGTKVPSKNIPKPQYRLHASQKH